MKTWICPEVEEVSFAQTQYGGQETTVLDNVYVNADGFYEGTFVS